MSRQCLSSFCLLLFTAFAAGAAIGGEAIKRQNVDVGTSLVSSDSGDLLNANAGLSLPVGDYWGAEFTLSAGSFQGDGSTLDSTSGGAGVFGFIGDKDVGRLGLRYSRENSEYDSSGSDFTIETESLTLLGEWYIDSVTLRYTRRHRENEVDSDSVIFSNPDGESSWLSAAYYATDNLRLGIGGGGLDADGSIYLDAEYQIGTLTSLQLQYFDNDDTDAVLVGLTFYFQGGSSLIENDRHY